MYILFSIFFVTSALYAADLGAGITTWYADWKMESEHMGNVKMDPVLYIGPSVAYQFTNVWSTTLVALMTPQQYEGGNQQNNETMKFRRYDVDWALNYQLNRYIKAFGGVKYLAFQYNTGLHHAAGPGIGVGFTFPVVQSIYFLANVSGLYIYGIQKEDQTNPDALKEKNFYEWGFNTSAQLAYYMDSLATTLTLGYRFQYIVTRYTDYGVDDDKKLEHSFKGITFSVVKSFQL